MNICQLEARSRGVWCQGEWEGISLAESFCFGADDTEFSRCCIAITEDFLQTTWTTTAVGELQGETEGITHQETMEKKVKEAWDIWWMRWPNEDQTRWTPCKESKHHF